MVNIQYVTDENGKTTGVVIPIEAWNVMKEQLQNMDTSDIEITEAEKKIARKRLKEHLDNPDSALTITEINNPNLIF